ncbi:MAG TPA: hypothetical protein VKY85_02605 [Candidatus Angelobacter sp.]|nr:hypothetical protein [Candidatus Angelobacter sp.]
MKALWISAITAGALTLGSACSSAQSSTSGNASAEPSATELVGTDVVVELSKSVDARKAKLGDPVKATVTQDVIAHGKIVIRRGSKLVGHVTQTKARSKEDQESLLGVVFDKAVLKGGREMDFVAPVRALAAPMRMSTVDKPDLMLPPAMGTSSGSNAPQPMGGRGATTGSGRGSVNSSASNNSATTSNQASQAAQAAQLSPVSTGKNPNSEFGIMGGGSRGVFGLPGLRLSAGSIISSTSQNVKLDSGTQMVIQVNNVAR